MPPLNAYSFNGAIIAHHHRFVLIISPYSLFSPHTVIVIHGVKPGYTHISLIDAAPCYHIDEGYNPRLANDLAFGYFGRQTLRGTKCFAVIANDLGGQSDKPNIVEPQTTHNRFIGGRGD